MHRLRYCLLRTGQQEKQAASGPDIPADHLSASHSSIGPAHSEKPPTEDASHPFFVPVVAYLLVFLLFGLGATVGAAAEPSLEILDAGPAGSEDAPFVSSDYRFYPGDYLYFRFQVAGFAVEADEKTEVRKIALAYEVTPQDASGQALTVPESGVINAELNAEDKNWTPKRRVSFLLPSFLASGLFRVHVVVKDVIAKSETARDFPFRIGGVTIASSPFITVQNFRFLRKEDDQQGLEPAAYRPGDTVYARFDMAGYQVNVPGNKYHLTYGLTVSGPDGKPFVEQPNAAELSEGSFYPAQFVPGNINLTTSRNSAKGPYLIVLTVRDLVANRTYETRRAFSLE
jgi:hypothetical protein